MAVEQHGRGLGRCRLELIADASANTLGRFLVGNVTDGWQGYRSATNGYHHQRHVVTGADPSALLPGVHRVSSLLKRWLLGTHQGGPASPPPHRYPLHTRHPRHPTGRPTMENRQPLTRPTALRPEFRSWVEGLGARSGV